MPINTDMSDNTAKELVDKLEDAAFIQRFEHSDDWKLFREACEHLASLAAHQILYTDAKDTQAIIEHQITIKFCRNILKSIISGIKEEGRIAFNEMRDRGIDPNNPIPHDL